MSERLQKILARAGFGSRRKCEELIRCGRVTIDGRMATLGDKADPQVECVALDGHQVQPESLEYWLLNKPKGLISTASDPHGRPTVVDSIPARNRIYPVGRLDQDTTGVLLLTNDGAMTNCLLHPSCGVEKEYVATVMGKFTELALDRLRNGIDLEDGRTAPAKVTAVALGDSRTEFVMVIHEGRKRQIRRMLRAVERPVLTLHRRRFDGITDSGLPIGEARRLLPEEIQILREVGGLV